MRMDTIVPRSSPFEGSWLVEIQALLQSCSDLTEIAAQSSPSARLNGTYASISALTCVEPGQVKEAGTLT